VSHIYENLVETEMDLIAIILPVCVNIKKYVRYICEHSQRSLCVTCRNTMKSQFDNSFELYDNISTKIYNNKCILGHIKNKTKKLEMFFRLVFFKYLMLKILQNSCNKRNVFRIYITKNSMSPFTSSTILRS
jgi:hypothetical protein